MEPDEDAYQVLGVERDATPSQIKAAYRKAALRVHPDKMAEEERETANLLFAKISNAYEILSDDEQREQYDASRSSRGRRNSNGGNGGSGSSWQQRRSSFHDDFFRSSFHQHHPFHDPFEVFSSVFRDEFGGNGSGSFNNGSGSSARRDSYGRRSSGSNGGSFHNHNDPFSLGGGMDPLFEDHRQMMRGAFGGRGGFPFGGMGGMGGSLFDDDPFMNGGSGGRGRQDIFSSMRQMQEDMRRSFHEQDFFHRQQQLQQQGNGGRNGNTFVFQSSSSTSFGGGGGNAGESVTTQTARRIVNGQEQVVTERIVRHADGTVERHVEQSGGNGSGTPMISSSTRNTAPAIQQQQQQEQPSQQEQQQQQQQSLRHFLPWRRGTGKNKDADHHEDHKRKRSS